MMTYLNGNDLPEHVCRTIRNVVHNNEVASFTSSAGEAILISKEEYNRLQDAAKGNVFASGCYSGCRPGKELDGYLRDEVDF